MPLGFEFVIVDKSVNKILSNIVNYYLNFETSKNNLLFNVLEDFDWVLAAAGLFFELETVAKNAAVTSKIALATVAYASETVVNA